jgi:hypothetical protein
MKTIGYGRIIKSNIKGKKGKYNHAYTREVSRNIRVYTRSDNKVMRLAPKKILFIHQLQSTTS